MFDIFKKSPKSTGNVSNFKVVARTHKEEEEYDFAAHRNNPKPSGIFGSIAHIVKGALGGGLLGGHVAYMKAGIAPAVALNFFFGAYIAYCLYILVSSAQMLYKRTRVPTMSYSDVGEASVACFPNPKISRFAKTFRYIVDAILCIDLFGSCAAYQIIIAKSIKQLVEDTHKTSMAGTVGYPSLRVYLAAMIVPLILICLITHLKWLEPFSVVANVVIVLCTGMAVYYAFNLNPKFQNMENYTSAYPLFEYMGMAVFSMSCAGVALPVENNMKDPKKYPWVFFVGMFINIGCVFCVSFFGYAAFLDKCETPITVNFPMGILPKILKIGIAVMIYVTHALNFWVPFNLCFHYLAKYHDKKMLLVWELFYRAVFVVLIAVIAILFPNINALMGFLGAFCLSNMAFIWPNLIYLLVVWERPGLGKFNWRLWKALVLMTIGVFLLFCGSAVNFIELISVFR